MRKVEFHPEAEQELEAARNWYRDRSDLAARAFATDLAHAVRTIVFGQASVVSSYPDFLIRYFIELDPIQSLSLQWRIKSAGPDTGDCANNL